MEHNAFLNRSLYVLKIRGIPESAGVAVFQFDTHTDLLALQSLFYSGPKSIMSCAFFNDVSFIAKHPCQALGGGRFLMSESPL